MKCKRADAECQGEMKNVEKKYQGVEGDVLQNVRSHHLALFSSLIILTVFVRQRTLTETTESKDGGLNSHLIVLLWLLFFFIVITVFLV